MENIITGLFWTGLITWIIGYVWREVIEEKKSPFVREIGVVTELRAVGRFGTIPIIWIKMGNGKSTDIYVGKKQYKSLRKGDIIEIVYKRDRVCSLVKKGEKKIIENWGWSKKEMEEIRKLHRWV